MPMMILCFRKILLLSICAGTALTCSAQQSFFTHWQDRVNRTQAEQPHWVTPLVTVTPRLEQEFRTDFLRQVQPSRTTTWNYDGGKGLELIPARRIELLVNTPPYLEHNTAAKDGFGDVSFVMKYRFYASNEEHHNAIVTAFFGGTIPTGSYSNGSTDATVAPTFAVGKGYGRFDVQSTLRATLPIANTKKLGHPIAWNTALQYKTSPNFFPEVEFNTTYYKGGPNDCNTQNFVMPGIVGRWRLHNRIGVTLGAGIQIATSQFHGYNHGLVFSGRIPF